MSKKNIILIIASMGIFVEALDIAIINLAIPSIQKTFLLSGDKVQWLQTFYVLFYGGFLIIGGKLSDVFGRKKIFLAGCSLFLVTSLGAGLAGSFELLLLFRAIQGLAAAFVMPSAFAIVNYYFTETHERGKAIGIFSSFAAIGSGSGLSLGGLISSYWGWQWVFFINVPVLAAVIILAAILLEKEKTVKAQKPDILSGLLLVTGLVILSFIVHLLPNFEQNSKLLLPLVAALAGCIYMVRYRITKGKNPLIDPSLFRIPSLSAGNGAFIALGAFFTSYLFLISIVLQQDMHFSAAKAGLILVPYSLLSAVVARFILPSILLKLKVVGTALLGMFCMLAGGLVFFLAVQHDTLTLLLCAAALISGLGMTICFTSFSVLAIQQVPAAHVGIGSSMTTTAYFFGGGMGISLISVFMPHNHLQHEVGRVPAIILCLYAALGVIWLLWYNRKQSANNSTQDISYPNADSLTATTPLANQKMPGDRLLQ
ncbi:MFS transporter [Mucilaginibacter dorajii]|uniref:MFS transporter n=1 Tax=Mucilaginibacter dorajii TaxID=692994 RepID=A0ABP7QLY1_9SPHI|nr:MFS transporter [Mucilaginibacter dorajii]MCS3735931.1 EmrB/QacA subfamily drug resistance transporter [Mucilaginibacter dorajii]